MKHLLSVALIALLSSSARSQTFTDLQWNLRGLSNGDVAFADYDNDGDEDFAMCGFGSTVAEWAAIFRIDNGVPVIVDSTIVHVSSGTMNWGDADHDGDLDLLVNGQTNGAAEAMLYRNDGNSVFTPVSTTGLPPTIGCMRFIDYDRDSLPDVILSGMVMPNFHDTTMLFHNDGNLVFTSRPIPNAPSFFEADICVGDYDQDSLPDFFLTGRGGPLQNGFCAIYHNDGGGNFSVNNSTLRQLFTGAARFGDYDHDGDIDLLYDGIDSTNAAFTLIYENNANVFTELADSLPGSGEPGDVDWADVDNDGDYDILISGTYLMINNGNHTYTDISPWTFIYGLPVSFTDFDHDGDQDVFLLNFTGGAASTMYRNELISGINTTEIKSPPTLSPILPQRPSR
ncbi:MAG: VCBS repeat-containing protein [Bacteroidia bacterium]